MTASLVCFYHKIPIGHIEAGLRTGDISNPFPEELNRVIISKVANLHFAPTEAARNNLIDEGIDPSNIPVTGNTTIDSLRLYNEKFVDLKGASQSETRQILVTIHRRENFGIVLEGICDAIYELVERNSDVSVLIPVHPNPEVKKIIMKRLGAINRIFLVNPLSYIDFVREMKMSYFILSDSGGVQEEAPALSKPVLVLRNKTERIEAIELGVAKLVGTDPKNIVKQCQILLVSDEHYNSMIKGYSPYGDGDSARKISEEILKYLKIKH
jgi:UDP-N-acetylglucosamine 2-epimerase (non-hydrolysing)